MFTNLFHESAYYQYIRELIKNEMRLRKIWQYSRNPRNKTILNFATKTLKEHLAVYKNKEVENKTSNKYAKKWSLSLSSDKIFEMPSFQLETLTETGSGRLMIGL